MRNYKKAVRKGFTLIELLVVIAILAVLAVVVILTLNPAGLLQEARDSNRISDMATLKSGISLYLADVPSPSLAPASGNCYLSIPSTVGMTIPSSTTPVATSSCNLFFSSIVGSSTDVTSTPNRSTTGTGGWIPVDMSKLSAGSPFAQWPIDPLNTTSSYYAYTASTAGNVFKIAMFMESSKYKNGGSADVVSTDGGINPYVFEGGSNLTGL